jgi:hypothetical protein
MEANNPELPLTLVLPSGDEILEPTEADLRAVIFDTDQHYWDSGSGDAALLYMRGRESVHDKPWLNFFMQEPHGFFVRFTAHSEPPSVPYDGSDANMSVVHYVGGDPLRLPLACFVSREAAWEVTKYFFAARERLPRLRWASLYDLPTGEK